MRSAEGFERIPFDFICDVKLGLVISAVSFIMNGAVCMIPGAQELVTRGEAAIAGLLAAMHDAKRVRDMREYPFWARCAVYMAAENFVAPRKILRDSPTRRDTPK